MNYQEFKDRTSKDVSYEQFQKWEKMYMVGHLDKDAFCKMVKDEVLKEVANAPHLQLAEQHRLEFLDALNHAQMEMQRGGNENAALDALDKAKVEAAMFFAEQSVIRD